jgi:hypothetical protein
LILDGNPDVIRYVLSHISLLQISDEPARRLAQFVSSNYRERGKNVQTELNFRNP